MAAIVAPALRLQKNLGNLPYGGAWWPSGVGLSHELLDLVHRWPSDLPSIVRYAYIADDWDRSEARIPTRYRTRVLILVLSDRSTCRLLQLPEQTAPEVAAELLLRATDPASTWRRGDFASTYRTPPPGPAAAVAGDTAS